MGRELFFLLFEGVYVEDTGGFPLYPLGRWLFASAADNRDGAGQAGRRGRPGASAGTPNGEENDSAGKAIARRISKSSVMRCMRWSTGCSRWRMRNGSLAS